VFPDGAAALGKALQDKKYLEVLCLKRNDIGLSGIKELQAALTNSKTVRILDFAGNNI